jgi:hypothetical protein
VVVNGNAKYKTNTCNWYTVYNTWQFIL